MVAFSQKSNSESMKTYVAFARLSGEGGKINVLSKRREERNTFKAHYALCMSLAVLQILELRLFLQTISVSRAFSQH
jgi:hypothetical protein